MLYSIDTNTYIWTIPHQEDYDIWRSRISDNEYEAIVTELYRKIDSDQIHTLNGNPGQDWIDTVFEPIYEKACRQDRTAAAKFFKLIFWSVLLEHREVWGFAHYNKDGMRLDGLTYFKLGNPP